MKIFEKVSCETLSFCRFRAYIVRGVFSALQKNKREEVIKMLKTKLEVVTVGAPDVTAADIRELYGDFLPKF